MQASAIRTYTNRFAVAPGKNISIFTTTDNGWRTVADLVRAGVGVAAVVDPRPHVKTALVTAAEMAGARVFLNAEVVGVHGTRRVRCIEISTDGRNALTVNCDALGVSGGFNPALGLSSHLGARPVWSDKAAAFVPDQLPPGLNVAGAARGVFSLAACLADGARAGGAAGGKAIAVPDASEDSDELAPLWRTRRIHGKAFVDMQNDVTENDVALAAREGFSTANILSDTRPWAWRAIRARPAH